MTTCSVPQSEGLSFLMEAATALANLPKASVPLSPQALNIYTIASSSVASSPCGNVLETSSSSSSSALLDATCDSANANKEIFPERLMVILNDDTLQDVVTWLPHGRSFVVLRPDVFSEQVLPKYFPPVDARAPAKYPSFTRKVNRW